MRKVRENMKGAFRSEAHRKEFCELRSISSSVRDEGGAYLRV